MKTPRRSCSTSSFTSEFHSNSLSFIYRKSVPDTLRFSFNATDQFRHEPRPTPCHITCWLSKVRGQRCVVTLYYFSVRGQASLQFHNSTSIRPEKLRRPSPGFLFWDLLLVRWYPGDCQQRVKVQCFSNTDGWVLVLQVKGARWHHVWWMCWTVQGIYLAFTRFTRILLSQLVTRVGRQVQDQHVSKSCFRVIWSRCVSPGWW